MPSSSHSRGAKNDRCRARGPGSSLGRKGIQSARQATNSRIGTRICSMSEKGVRGGQRSFASSQRSARCSSGGCAQCVPKRPRCGLGKWCRGLTHAEVMFGKQVASTMAAMKSHWLLVPWLLISAAAARAHAPSLAFILLARTARKGRTALDIVCRWVPAGFLYSFEHVAEPCRTARVFDCVRISAQGPSAP